MEVNLKISMLCLYNISSLSLLKERNFLFYIVVFWCHFDLKIYFPSVIVPR
jgi:hypothetical protein